MPLTEWTNKVATLDAKVRRGASFSSDDIAAIQRFEGDWRRDAESRDAKDKSGQKLTAAEKRRRANWSSLNDRLAVVWEKEQDNVTRLQQWARRKVNAWSPKQITKFKRAWADKVKAWDAKHAVGKSISSQDERTSTEGCAIWQEIGARTSRDEASRRDRLMLECESWASAKIVGWEQRGLQKEDYDFRSWAYGANGVPTDQDHAHMPLRLGAFYEYAREGRKLRGLLLMLDPDRKQDIYAPAFEGLTEKQAKEELFEMVDVLAFLSQSLAANLPFAEVWRGQKSLVQRALKHGQCLYDLRTRDGITTYWQMGRGAPVELAYNNEHHVATTIESLWHESQRQGRSSGKVERIKPEETRPRQIHEGKEVILLCVDWANYRDEHLKVRFGELVAQLRRAKCGGGQVPPEPEPQKKGKKAVVFDKALTRLRTARVLAHSLTADDAWQMLGLNLIAANRDESNYYRYAKEFRTDFKKLFPFEGEPAHSQTPNSRSK